MKSKSVKSSIPKDRDSRINNLKQNVTGIETKVLESVSLAMNCFLLNESYDALCGFLSFTIFMSQANTHFQSYFAKIIKTKIQLITPVSLVLMQD